MKKTIALLLSLIMLFALCACGRGEPSIGMPNPMTECASLEEVNEAVGGELCGPAAMGVTDEAYFVIDCGSYQIGEYRFKVNGCDYTMRCAKAKEDISGIYLNGQDVTAFSGIRIAAEGEETADGAAANADETFVLDSGSGLTISDSGMQSVSDDTYKCARWFVDDMQYVLTVNAGGALDDETFSSIASEFVNITQGNM